MTRSSNDQPTLTDRQSRFVRLFALAMAVAGFAAAFLIAATSGIG